MYSTSASASAVCAPVLQKTGFLRFVDEALFDEDREGAEDLRFVGRIEREIRMLPIAEARRAA